MTEQWVVGPGLADASRVELGLDYFRYFIVWFFRVLFVDLHNY